MNNLCFDNETVDAINGTKVTTMSGHVEDDAQFVRPWYNPAATHFGDHLVRFIPSRQDDKACAEPTQLAIPTGHEASEASRDLPHAGKWVRLVYRRGDVGVLRARTRGDITGFVNPIFPARDKSDTRHQRLSHTIKCQE